MPEPAMPGGQVETACTAQVEASGSEDVQLKVHAGVDGRVGLKRDGEGNHRRFIACCRSGYSCVERYTLLDIGHEFKRQ